MVTDTRLVGFWLSGPFEVGVMEDSEIGLLPDGRGWSALANFGGGLEVTRFRWHCPRTGELELREEWSLTGTWSADGGFASAGSPEPSGLVLRTGFDLPREPDASGEFRTTLRLVKPYAFCARYALSPRAVERWMDPSHRRVPYAED